MEQTRTYGFIGAGNMGSALVSALVQKQDGQNVLVSDPTAEKLEALKNEKGIVPSDNETIAKTADYVVLAVKPQVLPTVLPPLKDAFAANENMTIVTMAAGRVVWGLASAALYTSMGSAFSWALFAAGAVLNAVPGIILQLILIPAVIYALTRARLIPLEK